MPIPKPKSNEQKDAYISRCMAAIGDEYDDNAQAVAICHTQWRERKKMAKEPKLYEVTEEIFAEGIWNGMGFEAKDLEGIVSTFQELKDIHQVPLKFGHNDEQQMTDGQPALGWVDDIWFDNGKLMGKFVDVPEIVYEAMKQKKYRNKSIELDLDVSYKGSKYEHVLSGVALLGADIPAVNTLNDLSYYLASRRDSYAAANHLSFTINNREEISMSEIDELKAKVTKLEAKVDTLTTENKELETANAKFSRQVEDLEKDKEERIKADAKASFDRDVESFKVDVEKQVEEKKITPATRDKLLEGINDVAGLEKAKFSLDMFKDNAPVIDPKPAAFSGSDDEKNMTADAIVAARVTKLRAEQPSLEYSVAKKQVLENDEDLARAYVTMT